MNPTTPRPHPTRNPTTNPTNPTTRTPRPHGPNPTRVAPPAGWIYLHITPTDPRKYVGQTTRPPYKRINEERRTFTWGHELLPGRDGYRVLRRVESLGRPDLDAIALDLAEAEEIARLHPTENANRPDPAVFRARLDAAMRGAPTPPHAPGQPHGPQWLPMDFDGKPVEPTTPRQRAPRPVPWGFMGRAVLAVVWGFLALRVTLAPDMPGPTWTPWVVVPLAVMVGPTITVWWGRRLRGRKKPARRRRRR